MSRKVYEYDEHVLDTLGATYPDRWDPDWSPFPVLSRSRRPRKKTMKLIEFLDREWLAEPTEAGREAIAEARAVAIREMEG
jgi:hypothetical protein